MKYPRTQRRQCSTCEVILQMSVTVKGDVKALPVYGGIDVDFYGHSITGTNRMPGPFADLTDTAGSRTIDPR